MNEKISKDQANKYIRSHCFSQLFIDLGWDVENLPQAPLVLELRDGESFSINRIAEKRGFAVCVCDAGNNYPSTKADRRRVVNQLARHHYEHLLIIRGESKQCWTVAIRPKNRPLRTVEVEWNENQDTQPLMEKLDGMIFDISEEEELAITDVVDRVRDVFMENAEKITKRFYGEFRKELSAFAGFIEGIQDQVSKEWYAALMLNRLMFIYFIQKKRFLDGDVKYLENRLSETQKKFGADKFHDCFYRHFLKRLFTEGLDTPQSERGLQLQKLLGDVPYLNGGLFDLHEIEKQNENIDIKDQAFEKLFNFFGEYKWHLDTRSTADGKDINPDVIGYIFEKYINDRAAMGAYYTQEDVTGYIARNTVIPFLLQRAKEKCKNAFDSETGIWRFLRENPDNYIYDAVKKGCDISDKEIPENIRCGIDTKAPDLIKRRKDWNTKTEQRFALPTEIWRETIARRERYFELKAKIENGDICEIDDLITYNLDIERFASDALRYYEGSDFIAAFFKAIAGQKSLRSNQKEQRGITILDPACGSGAFLFAALNVLEPLYEQCTKRMEDFVEEDDQLHEEGKRKGTKRHPQFREFLEEIAQHPNRNYWIYKTIILNNLYGVDLMKEAAEIAKLRLFLKLAATAEYDPNKNNLGLEPLPDIDFNIRSGNSLVGFASMAQFEQSLTPDKGQQAMDLSGGMVDEIREEAQIVQNANNTFKYAQDVGGELYRQAKLVLNDRLATLNDKMNHFLAKQYGSNEKEVEYKQWLKSHQPFHWLTEFYGIIEENGGFDVVIGNPPYVKYTNVKDYSIKNYETELCNNLYAYVVELSLILLSQGGRFSMIIPISFVSSKKMLPIRENVLSKCNRLWTSNFAIRPQPLFSDVMQRHSIIMGYSGKPCQQIFTTNYQRWVSTERDLLFHTLQYSDLLGYTHKENFVHKIESDLGINILNALKNQRHQINKHTSDHLYFHDSGESYWTKASWDKPEAYRNGIRVDPSQWFILKVSPDQKPFLYLLLNSSLFYWLWTVETDCRHMTKSFVNSVNLPFDCEIDKTIVNEIRYAHEQNTKIFEKRSGYKSPEIKVHNFKPLLDKVDNLLAKHYGFTEEELDYIINYDIKYRMGITK